MRYITGDEYQG